jgi:hypothetical protein
MGPYRMSLAVISSNPEELETFANCAISLVPDERWSPANERMPWPNACSSGYLARKSKTTPWRNSPPARGTFAQPNRVCGRLCSRKATRRYQLTAWERGYIRRGPERYTQSCAHISKYLTHSQISRPTGTLKRFSRALALSRSPLLQWDTDAL